ncbi:MAG TPA: type I DNA topoisomerase [Candidatus Avilachnospira avistercoris]|nr:type I DNA topoisomerase [Candidatus Avilachnospira avistercoris]
MGQSLVIVESPAKMRTIKKFLGSSYTVAASMGHVRDLPKSTMGIDIEHDFEPKYIAIRGKGDLISSLKKEVKKADKIYLATDPDREGEAISWHLMSALGLNDMKDKEVYRITFNEITKNAVKAAIKSPREIDDNLVDAQQARRVMDRLVGYTISPVLWKKIRKGLSAGRVQSATLNIICKREEEIAAFIPKEYFTIDGTIKNRTKTVKAQYLGENGKHTELNDRETAEAIVEDVKRDKAVVSEIKNSERLRNSPLPFTTSTMQQEAARVLNMSPQKTMRIAQKLYEGVDVKGHGSIGLITYLRTDSVRISDEAFEAAKGFVGSRYGKEYVSYARPVGKNSQNVQDAHEAIRPTYIDLMPAELKDQLERDEFRLYQLIWNRYVASRMTPARYDTTSVRLHSGSHTFTASGSKLKFDGFLSVYKNVEETEEKQDLSFMKEGDVIAFDKLEAVSHMTEPPAHYTEASLVRKMEEDGIGRPSTYAPTIATLTARRYITKEKKNLYVTELGTAVNELMKGSFPSIVDEKFTANMEYMLDSVAEGKTNWKELIRNFYPDLKEAVDNAEKNLGRVKIADEVTDVICDKCGRNMVIKYGPHGKFLACPGFPECRNTKPYVEKIGLKCPRCGKDIIVRRSKKGRLFYACEDPECEYISFNKPKGDKNGVAIEKKLANAEKQ